MQNYVNEEKRERYFRYYQHYISFFPLVETVNTTIWIFNDSQGGIFFSLSWPQRIFISTSNKVRRNIFVSARMEEEKGASNAQILWSACQALARAVKIMSPDVTIRPLEHEIKAVSKAARKCLDWLNLIFDKITSLILRNSMVMRNPDNTRFAVPLSFFPIDNLY